MDEIITRWATDLSKYQKSFQSQAKQVAEWDRMLVENSDKISKLYSKTFQARKDTEEVERQLTAVESDQAELSRWLDNYEKEVDDLMDKMVGGQDGLQGPDQERERTYKLAEKLSDRLNDLNKDLSDMIEEINSVSATLSKTDKPDDPLSQVVRVLNNHLSQLQAIDSGAAELHEKVTKAQKEAQSYRVNGQAVLGNDAADDFYRSFMGRR
ncbi:putative nucleoporin nsp1-like protein [Diplodia seriata]|nr:putative nucleoporin nsp1-like protein [Diplodia seriata]